MNKRFIDQFIRNNFLAICIFLAMVFAVAKGATVFQKKSDTPVSEIPNAFETADFKKYWYNGKVEVSSYELQQTVAGISNTGEASLVFETVDFLTNKHVISVSANNPDATTVLQLKSGQQLSGNYPGNGTILVFSPVNTLLFPHALKASVAFSGIQNKPFASLNLRNRTYELAFEEKQGKTEKKLHHLERLWIEDELWTRLRLAPQKMPVGKVLLIPSLRQISQQHNKIRPREAEAKIDSSNARLLKYELSYPERKLSIAFLPTFPYRIEGWEETTRVEGKEMTTKAVFREIILTGERTKMISGLLK
ncbi:hypothetical protein SAMN04515674_103343 [Pseudarcicella hirudinis]|uniref:Uncharacterized protein n=1 Tax=Pseudarcicella hirudinis TaxID=1079859 RepID=A0A1I5QSG2_9BACT|nr:hypothetical protein [Pseudarcicella hirudinis]SFP49199.1 hypothetical protein SAMN04515674_103343 [Pseudarcicella hirudinis]